MYIPLARAQKLSDNNGKVNQIYVRADSAEQHRRGQEGDQGGHAQGDRHDRAGPGRPGQRLAVERLEPGRPAGQVAGRRGARRRLPVASLLTVSAVSRRVREFGTLKALGWKSRRIVGQVLGESVVQGIAGGVIGVALGIGGARLIAAFSPDLKATMASTARRLPARPPGGGRDGGARRRRPDGDRAARRADQPEPGPARRRARPRGRPAGRRFRRLARRAPAARRRPAPARLIAGDAMTLITPHTLEEDSMLYELIGVTKRYTQGRKTVTPWPVSTCRSPTASSSSSRGPRAPARRRCCRCSAP